MPRRSRLRRRLLGLIAAAFVLGGAAPTVTAQEEARPDVDQFGGFIASARANALSITYDSPGLLPVSSPVIDISVPEALATLNSGPVGYGLASFVFPGPLLADLGAALEAGGTETGLPPYPVRSEAFYPSGPREADGGGGTARMTAITEFADSMAQTTFAGLDVPPVVNVGSITATSQTVVDGDQLVARTRSAVADVSILAGLIHIDSVTTELVSTSNGETAATVGDTTVSGATVLGLPVTIDGDGIHFAPDNDRNDPDDGEGGGKPLLPGVPEPTLPPDLSQGLEDVVAPLNELLDTVGAAGDDALQQLFDASGIEIKVLDAAETVEDGLGSRVAGGLSITLNYDGGNTPVLTDLLGLVPSDQLPSDDLGPIPFSPQGLFNLLKKTHVIGFNVAPASVSTQATPAFDFAAPPVDIDTPDVTPTPTPTSPPAIPTQPSVTPDFTTPAPNLGEQQTVVSTVPASSPSSLLLGIGLPVFVGFAAVLALPFFGIGSARLADRSLAAASTACPTGADHGPGE